MTVKVVIFDLFETLVSDPHIYQHACKNLGVAPSDCIFIGDGNSDELRGAAQSWHVPVLRRVVPPSAYRRARRRYCDASSRRLSSIVSSIRVDRPDARHLCCLLTILLESVFSIFP